MTAPRTLWVNPRTGHIVEKLDLVRDLFQIRPASFDFRLECSTCLYDDLEM
jgi:hypothetical protein